MKNKLLLALDIGNVCIRINHLNCAGYFGYDAIPEKLAEVALKYECGKCSENGFFAEIHSLLEGRFAPEQIREAFDSILIEPVPGMVELVNSFPELGVQAVFFSDISPTHLRRTREIFPAARHVPEGIYSFAAGALKPSKEMFDAFEKKFGRPDLYVDDRAELIAGAKEYGWHAVIFSSAEQLKVELMTLAG